VRLAEEGLGFARERLLVGPVAACPPDLGESRAQNEAGIEGLGERDPEPQSVATLLPALVSDQDRLVHQALQRS
jgi:hypothetical protein